MSARIKPANAALRPWGGVEIEDPATWPEPIHALLERSLPLIRAYEAERKRIAKLKPQWATGRPTPSNPHREDRDRMVERISAALAHENIVGYHASRLHADEMQTIRAAGMVPLSADRLGARIRRRCETGDIPEALAARLLVEHGAACDARAGMLWFVNSRSALQDESGMHRLFRYWGGEALYHRHERDEVTAPLLRGIGEPCIIVAAIPVDRFTIYHPLGARFYAAFARRHRFRTEHGPEFEGNLKSTLPAAQIRAVIPYSDPRFETLTGCSRWQQEIA